MPSVSSAILGQSDIFNGWSNSLVPMGDYTNHSVSKVGEAMRYKKDIFRSFYIIFLCVFAWLAIVIKFSH